MNKPNAPRDIPELMMRVNTIAGLTLGEIAAQYAFKTPENLLREKGWIGQLIEYVLGATAASKPEPDFPHLGVELKTLPISYTGKPLETTYVSITPLTNLHGVTWQNSVVKKKLSHVLWLPILSERDLAPTDRIIGNGFLWKPSQQEEALLKKDWEELTEMIALGNIEQVNGHFGQVLQLRPKAANSKALTQAIGPNGSEIMTLPRGYYLKTEFTKQILAKQFGGG
ncbi:DNA mismatch repair endonuclease MutH [Pseudoalteromonas sp. SSM20]|uniref:DNA mismatch repair endonuclease MutH n=1 Tax=unclassified Pseudoalteromonas TaxID=194690 RepID=UPI00237DF8C1|nr:DNA mismatch repair endonuclease MutH [Pseudoalteromonas sp. G4]MDE3271780.1 DNA mismatch repair endonuclease MutH [Pseudoalteromonas sp. G4]